MREAITRASRRNLVAIDPLAKRLRRLLEDGALPASQLSRRARQQLVGLFDAEILTEELSGAGRRVVLHSRTGLENWIGTHYPHGLDGRDDVQGMRAAGVANLRDSKRGGTVGATLIHLRGFGQASLRRGGEIMPVADLTRRFGAASLRIDDTCTWSVSGRICTVENLEFFLRVEEIIPALDLAIYTHGRLSQQVIDWLAAHAAPDARIVHAGDYDPVGLAEYLRIATAVGARAQLFVPANLSELIERYGNARLLRESRKCLEDLHHTSDPQVRQVVAFLDTHGRALEQEALLVDLDVDPRG